MDINLLIARRVRQLRASHELSLAALAMRSGGWRLEAGDTLGMRLDRHIVYHNPSSRQARYLVALVTHTTSRRTA